jgi:hypothetical protein
VQLPAADVERDHVRRPALEQTVREAAGRGADVERLGPGHVPSETVERDLELLAARETKRASASTSMRWPSRTGAPALVTGTSSTRTRPAMIRARARARDGASPRSWTATSSLDTARG